MTFYLPLTTRLQNTQREDIVFVLFQIWVLGMSVVALLNESVPHIVAALLTHVLATTWSAFQLADTRRFQESFLTLTVDGACKGVSLLPNYWRHRGVVEVRIDMLCDRLRPSAWYLTDTTRRMRCWC